MARSRTPDYTVGYKKPPKHSQFPPGVSGNRKGRPPKERQGAAPDTPNAGDDMVSHLLDEVVTIDVDGEKRRVTRREALHRNVIAQAMSEDMRAYKLVHEMDARGLAARAATRALEETLATALSDQIREFVAWQRERRRAGDAQEAPASEGAPACAPGAELPVTRDAAAPAHAAEHACDYADEGEEEAEPCLVGTRRPAAPPPAAPSTPAAAAAPEIREFSSGLAGALERTHWQETQGQGVTPPRLSSRHARPASASGPLIRDTRPMTRHF